MKISLNWVFDHIKGELAHVDVAQLVSKFIKTTAEIEEWKKVCFNVDEFTLVRIVSIDGESINAYSAEHNTNYTLSTRADGVVDAWYLIKEVDGHVSWADVIDCGGTKDVLLPSLDVAETLRAGGWKCAVEPQDYIIDIDNKSINNRPDLWGHRGIAREIAAILDLPLRSLEEFIVQKSVVVYSSAVKADNNMPFSIAITAPNLCKKIAATHLDFVSTKSSMVHMAIRLSRVDGRAIDALVDTTNYVMFDLGQPMHAFDAQTFSTKEFTVGRAQDKEKLLLLDGSIVELTSHDIVIADGGRAISLAGVMGGAATSISNKTQSVLIEAANFDAATIRRTANRYKKITESSKRFEKSLDPQQVTYALLRFLFLLDKAGIAYRAGENVVVVGQQDQQITIKVEHAFIESRLGVKIESQKIISILEKLFFVVTQSTENEHVVYTVVVPSLRATKDIKIAEDIVEEVGRYYGYDLLPRVMPALQLRPSDLHATYRIREIKRLLSYGLSMRELYGYSFFDESVLRELAWEPMQYVKIKNPISENYTRLVTTLQPHILKSVGENSIHHTQLRFYEWGRVWHMDGDTIIEQKSLSGIFYQDARVHEGIDFYAGKALLSRLFDQLHMSVSWQSCGEVEFPWLMPYQTALLMYGDMRIGVAGMIDKAVVHRLSPAGGTAFIFELNGDFLLDYKKTVVRFDSLSKYPSASRDISILVSVSLTADELVKNIKIVDPRIESVVLVDFFTKPEWQDQKAMTFHVEMCDKEKTLSADDVDLMWTAVIERLQQQGAVIR